MFENNPQKPLRKKLNILFIEDDEIEVMKLNRALGSMSVKHQILGAENGEKALELLNSKDQQPDIILLDLNMPRMNGIEFLKILKDHENFQFIPTIILTTSNNRRDVMQCFKMGIAGYIIKPLKYDDYVIKIKSLFDYWSMNELIRG